MCLPKTRAAGQLPHAPTVRLRQILLLQMPKGSIASRLRRRASTPCRPLGRRGITWLTPRFWFAAHD